MFVEIQNFIIRDADDRMSCKIIGVGCNCALFAIIERDTRAKECVFNVREHRNADRRIKRREHIPGQLRNSSKRGLLNVTFTFCCNVVVEIRNHDDARVFVDICAIAVEREAAAIHTLMMLHGGQFHAF